jgi:hypothetical protein
VVCVVFWLGFPALLVRDIRDRDITVLILKFEEPYIMECIAMHPTLCLQTMQSIPHYSWDM